MDLGCLFPFLQQYNRTISFKNPQSVASSCRVSDDQCINTFHRNVLVDSTDGKCVCLKDLKITETWKELKCEPLAQRSEDLLM